MRFTEPPQIATFYSPVVLSGLVRCQALSSSATLQAWAKQTAGPMGRVAVKNLTDHADPRLVQMPD